MSSEKKETKTGKDQETLSSHSKDDSVGGSDVSGSTTAAEDTGLTGVEKSPGVDNPAFDMSNEEKKSDSLELTDLSPPRIMANADKIDIEKGEKTNGESGGFGEQFVSVNEHKKGLRGEKLYVTKDNRQKNASCKSCWAVLGTLFLIAVIVVAVLVGVGVIDPHPQGITALRQANESNNNDPLGPKISESLDPDAPTTTTLPTTTTTAMNQSVPNVFDGNFRIVNKEWAEALENKESPEYQEMASVIAKALKELLPGATVDVKKFSSGSVIVDFRITLPNGEVLSREEVEEKLREAFREGKILDDFEVDANSVQTDDVQNLCEDIDCNGGSCEFIDNSFKCLCPEYLRFDEELQTCIDPFQDTTTSTEKMDYDEAEAIAEVDQDDTNADLLADINTADESSTTEHSVGKKDDPEKVVNEMEITAAPEAEADVEAESEVESLPEGESEAESVPEAESEAESVPEAETEDESVPEAESEAESVPEAESEAESVPEAESESESEAESEYETKSEAKAESETTTEAKVTNEVETEAPFNVETHSEFEQIESTESGVESETTETIETEPRNNAVDFQIEAETEDASSDNVTSEPEAESETTDVNGWYTTETGEAESEVEHKEEDDSKIEDIVDPVAESEAEAETEAEYEPTTEDESSIGATEAESSSTMAPETTTEIESVIDDTTQSNTVAAQTDEPNAIQMTSTSLDDEAMTGEETTTKLSVTEAATSTSGMPDDQTTHIEATTTTEETTQQNDEEKWLGSIVEVTTTLPEITTNTTETETLTNEAESTTLLPSTTITEESAETTTITTTTSTISTTTTTKAEQSLNLTISLKGDERNLNQNFSEEVKKAITNIISEVSIEETTLSPTSFVFEEENVAVTTTTTANPNEVVITISTESPVTGQGEEASSVKVNIPVKVDNEIEAKELEDKLRDLVQNVTKEFELSASTETLAPIETTTASETIDETTIQQEEITSTVVNESIDDTTTTDGSITETSTSQEITTISPETDDLDEVTTITTTTESESSAVPRKLEVDSTVNPNRIKLAHDLEKIHNDKAEEDLKTDCSDGFRCGSRECIHRNEQCDQVQNCRDGSDELDCDKNTCLPTEFKCSNGRCIHNSLKCNGLSDCPNGEDEFGCETKCDPGYFLCKEGRCLSDAMRCNGVFDCHDGEDEDTCNCAADEFQCRMGGGCIMSSKMCDGHFDCADNSDEWGCVRLTGANPQNGVIGTLQVLSKNDIWEPVCSNEWTNAWSARTCHQLGFDGVAKAANVAMLSPNATVLRVNNSISAQEHSLQEAVYEADNKSCRAVVGLECQSYECGNWPSIGNEEPLQWPSVAYLFHVRSKKSCTATIIGTQWILTSHKCVSDIDENPEEWVAFGGPATPADTPDGLQTGTQIKIIDQIVSHPGFQFKQGLFSQDMALVKLVEGFEVNEMVKPVCLADTDVLYGQRCVVVGWSDADKGVTFHQYLETVLEPNLNATECNGKEHYNGLLGPSVICAESDASVCRADFGAPLMCQDNNGIWSLFGILSHEGECRVGQKHPDVFTSVPDLRSWIEQTMGKS